MRTKQVKELLVKMVENRYPVLLTGAPGVGKTDIVSGVASELGMEMIVSHPVVSDPTDAKGLPWAKNKEDGGMPTEATFLPFGELARALNAKNPTLWLLDDLGQAPPAVQASFMQLLLSRRVNGHILPDCVTFVAASNRRGDRAGVSGILEPVKSRFATIVEVDAHIDDWTEWAMSDAGKAAGVRESDVAFLRFKPDMLHNFNPSADLENSPSPRTWVSAARIMGMGLSKNVTEAAVAGAVGTGAAKERMGFEEGYLSEKVILDIIESPLTYDYPSKPHELYACITSMAYRLTADNVCNITDFAVRLYSDSKGEFCSRLLRDIGNKPEFQGNSEAMEKVLSNKDMRYILSH